MRVSVNQRGYTLSNLTTDELNAVMFLLGQAKKQCFHDCHSYRDSNGGERYADGGGFTASLEKKERDAFYSFVDEFWHEHDKMRERLRRTRMRGQE